VLSFVTANVKDDYSLEYHSGEKTYHSDIFSASFNFLTMKHFFCPADKNLSLHRRIGSVFYRWHPASFCPNDSWTLGHCLCPGVWGNASSSVTDTKDEGEPINMGIDLTVLSEMLPPT